jgi:hypothetical protein
MEIVNFLVFVIVASAIYIYSLAEQNKKISEHNKQLREKFFRYENIASQEDYLKELEEKITDQENQTISLGQDYDDILNKLALARQELWNAKEEMELQSLEIDTSILFNFSAYAEQLKDIKIRQRQLVQNRQAISCPVNWTISGSSKNGRRLVESFSKLILLIFDNTCKSIISEIKPGNFEQKKREVERKYLSLNRDSKIIQCEITVEYLDLKIHELKIYHALQIVKQEEKEIKEKARLEEKDRKALAKIEKEILEKEQLEQKCQQDIDAVRKEIELAKQDEFDQLNAKLERLENELTQARLDRETAENKSRRHKSGYIFVISNIGSFGRNIYRICSTKRTDEDNHISDMTPVVPFPFDIHFKFFSNDVNETIKLLHERFQENRVNSVNPRRDFFDVPFEEIESAIRKISQDTGNIKGLTAQGKAPDAYEYRKTQQQNQNSNNEKYTAEKTA